MAGKQHSQPEAMKAITFRLEEQGGSKRKRDGDLPLTTNRICGSDSFHDTDSTSSQAFLSDLNYFDRTNDPAQHGLQAFVLSYNGDCLFSRHGHHETTLHRNDTARPMRQSHTETTASGFSNFPCEISMQHAQALHSAGAIQAAGATSVNQDRTQRLFHDHKSFEYLQPHSLMESISENSTSIDRTALCRSDLASPPRVQGRGEAPLPHREFVLADGHTDAPVPNDMIHSRIIDSTPGPSFEPVIFGAVDGLQPSMYPAPYDTHHHFDPNPNDMTASRKEDSQKQAGFDPHVMESSFSSWESSIQASITDRQSIRPAMGGGETYDQTLRPQCGTYLSFTSQPCDTHFGHSSSGSMDIWSRQKSPQVSTAEQPSVTGMISSSLPETSIRDSTQETVSEGPQENLAVERVSQDNSHQVRKRGPFDSRRRRETAETRKRKACLRCRVQKIRCDADYGDMEGACLSCKGFSKVSKKTLHHVSCYRGKLTDVTLYRKGGLGLTSRWTGTEMKDVGDRINADVRTIQITLGICSTPITIKVVRFKAVAGDVVARFWTVREGERGDEIKKKKDLEPFCLVDIWATAAAFEKYIIDHAIPTILKVHTPHRLLENTFLGADVISRTYITAVQYYLSLDDEVTSRSGKVSNPQKKLLGNLFVLWLAIRHTSGSAYICGEDTLGMKPEVKDDTYPLFGRVSIPRMLIAQFDSINHTKLLSKYGQRVLRELEIFIFRNQSSYWWTIYLCIFILLHEASWLSADRYRHARNNYGGRYRYSIPSFVEELQEGCNNILIHWHYYNCHPWPDPDAPWERHKHFMSELSSEQHDLVMETLKDRRIQKQLAVWKMYREQNGIIEKQNLSSPVKPHESPYMGSQTQFDWDHPCYWIAQMFEERWQPHPTYQREFAG